MLPSNTTPLKKPWYTPEITIINSNEDIRQGMESSYREHSFDASSGTIQVPVFGGGPPTIYYKVHPAGSPPGDFNSIPRPRADYLS